MMTAASRRDFARFFMEIRLTGDSQKDTDTAPRSFRAAFRKAAMMALAFGLAAGVGHACAAKVCTWSGGGGNGHWTSPLNWKGHVVPVPGDMLTFMGHRDLTTHNDFAAGTKFSGIAMLRGAGSFVLDGHAMALQAGGIDDLAVNPQSINLDIALTGDTHINVVSGGKLIIRGAITDVSTQGYGSRPVPDANVSAGGYADTGDGGQLELLSSAPQRIGGKLLVGQENVVLGSKINLTLDGNKATSGLTYALMLGYGNGLAAFASSVTQNGGRVTVQGSFIGGQNKNSRARYTIRGGTLTVNGRYYRGGNNGKFTLNVVDGTVHINGKNIWIGENGHGALTIDGGAVTLAHTAEINNGRKTGTGVINLNGGLLAADHGFYQGPANGRASLNLNGGALRVAGQVFYGSGAINVYVKKGGAIIDTHGTNAFFNRNLIGSGVGKSGAGGGLTKIGAGTLNLSSDGNTYTGNTIVKAGTLVINTPFLGAASAINIFQGAKMYLHYSGTDRIRKLIIAGTVMKPGVYGRNHHQAAFFSGDGTLTVDGGKSDQ